MKNYIVNGKCFAGVDVFDAIRVYAFCELNWENVEITKDRFAPNSYTIHHENGNDFEFVTVKGIKV